MVFIRSKKIKGKTYYYIVENKRQGKTIKQQVIKYIGTADKLLQILQNKKGEQK